MYALIGTLPSSDAPTLWISICTVVHTSGKGDMLGVMLSCVDYLDLSGVYFTLLSGLCFYAL
jgi:hypothetical protein